MRKQTKQKFQISLVLSALLLGGGLLLNEVNTAPVKANDQVKTVTSKTLVDVATTNWKYLDDNSDPASGLSSLQAWSEPTFDDQAWSTAIGSFGAKKGLLVSFDGFTPQNLLKQYYEESKNTPTFFFRTTLNITDINDITSIKGKFYHDDAVAVYINGKCVSSIDMPTDVQSSNMYYAGVSAGAPKEGIIDLRNEKIKEYFVEGNNTIAVELHNDRETSSDLYFEFRGLQANYGEEEEAVIQKTVTLNIGENQTSKNISWFANTEALGAVQYTKKANVVNGVFPSEYHDVKASVTPANEATFYANQASLTNLEANSEYAYRLVNGSSVSPIYYFQTKAMDTNFNFVLVGDPQIGSSGVSTNTENWQQTLNLATSTFNPDFIVSAGDQVNTASKEDEYAGYVLDAFKSYAQAPSIGNHDSNSEAYNQHFNLPNESVEYGTTKAGGDYWYVYNDTLFMNINSNDRSTAEHKAFLEDAIAKNPDVRWKTVIFHHSIYSTADHVNDGDIINRRNELPTVFEELDIDVVLMGHDHVYTRTYMMENFMPDTSQGVQASVTDPSGILYLTANSASGSKYYDITAPDAEYAAVQDQSYRRTFTNVEVSNTSYKMTTYYSDNLEVLDTFTIYKSVVLNASQLEVALTSTLEKVETLNAEDYTEASWSNLTKAIEEAKDALNFVNEKGKSKAKSKEYTQEEINQIEQNLLAAYEGLEIKEEIKNPPVDSTQKPSVDGNVKSTSKDLPATGDTTNNTAWFILLVGASTTLLIIKKKKA